MTGIRVVRATVAVVAMTGAVVLAGGTAAQAGSTPPDGVVEAAKSLAGGAQYNVGFVVFVAKDQTGGAYWLTTTTGASALEAATVAGRDALLTINRGVLVPLEKAAGIDSRPGGSRVGA